MWIWDFPFSRELPPGLADIDTAVPSSSQAWVAHLVPTLHGLETSQRAVIHKVLASLDQSWSLVPPLWRRALEHDIVRP